MRGTQSASKQQTQQTQTALSKGSIMKSFTTYVILILVSVLFGFLAGMQTQKLVVENECAKLGGFYFGNNVYQCVASR
jgi:hypothetical protein